MFKYIIYSVQFNCVQYNFFKLYCTQFYEKTGAIILPQDRKPFYDFYHKSRLLIGQIATSSILSTHLPDTSQNNPYSENCFSRNFNCFMPKMFWFDFCCSSYSIAIDYYNTFDILFSALFPRFSGINALQEFSGLIILF